MDARSVQEGSTSQVCIMSCPMGFGARKPCDRGENSGLRADGEEDDKSRSFYDSSLQTGFVSFHVECDENFNISG